MNFSNDVVLCLQTILPNNETFIYGSGFRPETEMFGVMQLFFTLYAFLANLTLPKILLNRRKVVEDIVDMFLKRIDEESNGLLQKYKFILKSFDDKQKEMSKFSGFYTFAENAQQVATDFQAIGKGYAADAEKVTRLQKRVFKGAKHLLYFAMVVCLCLALFNNWNLLYKNVVITIVVLCVPAFIFCGVYFWSYLFFKLNNKPKLENQANQLISDFKSKLKDDYHNRLDNLIEAIISAEQIQPKDVLNLVSPETKKTTDVFPSTQVKEQRKAKPRRRS